MNKRTYLDIRRIRLQQGLSQRDLAWQAGMTVAELTRLERGLAPASSGHVQRLESALGIAFDGLEPVEQVSGEGYVTALPGSPVTHHRRKAHDIRLRPVIDLFCGVGGLSAGFEATGEFEVVAGVDLLGDRLDTFTTNHPAANAYGCDIRTVAVDTLAAENPHPFAVIGGPPCQGFSRLVTRPASESSLSTTAALCCHVVRLWPYAARTCRTSAATCSGGVCGTIPCPRLNTCGRPRTASSTPAASARNASPPATSANGSKLP